MTLLELLTWIEGCDKDILNYEVWGVVHNKINETTLLTSSSPLKPQENVDVDRKRVFLVSTSIR